MTKILVLCNHSDIGDIRTDAAHDVELRINPSRPDQNLELHIDNITHRIVSELNPLAQDLLEIAAYVYYADCSIQRGAETDVYADKWRRRFEFVIPVSSPDQWNRSEIRDLLAETIDFVTDDEISFCFNSPKRAAVQLYFQFPDMPPPFPESDCVCLFSGGLDSLVGSLFLVKERNKHPLLVSHRSMPAVDARQKRLVESLRGRNQKWQFPHLSVWINRMGNRAVEATQRTRSFLYLSIATAVALQLGIRRIYICENGVVSVNIPVSGQNVGTLLTRSTHPKFLELFQRLVQELFMANISIENPFIFSTKTEMLSMLANWSQSELMQDTVSCAYTQGRTKLQPQCGTCFQCVNRRFSVLAAGLERDDRVQYYEKDLFLDSLEEGRETICAEGYVRTAFEINRMNDVQFFAKYPQLGEVISSLDVSAEKCGRRLYELFQRHAHEVTGVATAKCNEYQRDLLAGKLPPDCLVSMLASRHHLQNPLDAYADKIAKVLGDAFRIDFRTEKPKKESRLQEGAQAVLKAADERLRRESPMLSYSVVGTKPDFARITDYNRLLFVELKLLNNRSKLNKIVTEITSRITVYRDQGAFALFVVYDTADFITDDDEFIRDFERHEGTKTIVVR